MTGSSIRRAQPADEPFLWEMLYHAAHLYEEGLTPDDVQGHAVASQYLEGWGRPGDFGLVALEPGDEERLGATWIRQYPESHWHARYVDAAVPELSIAVRPDRRGLGVGERLLIELVSRCRDTAPTICLNVREENPARRLYERVGFAPVPGARFPNRAGGHSIYMVRT